MPELPDLTVYVEALERRVVGAPLSIRLASPFVLRTVEPRPAELAGRAVRAVRRMEKRIVLEVEGDLFAVLHLMVAGRLRWDDAPGAKIPGRIGLAALDVEGRGTLLLTEASTKKRAALHLVRGAGGLEALRRGGLEPLGASLADFTAALTRERHTLKRALTDPRIFAGIGNAYSDEILHRARLSPMARTDRLDAEAVGRLHAATLETLAEWIARLRAQVGDGFPGKGEVTAFRPEMAVHGKYKAPCPVCGTAVQRIVYAENESNYCPRCQTGGKLLSDRSLSRLLRGSWPRTIEELEGR